MAVQWNTLQYNRKEHTSQRCERQCNGSPAGGALSPKWLRPSPSTIHPRPPSAQVHKCTPVCIIECALLNAPPLTIHHRHKCTSATPNAMHQGIQASRHCAFHCAVYSSVLYTVCIVHFLRFHDKLCNFCAVFNLYSEGMMCIDICCV